MAESYTRLAQQQATASAATLYTAPSSAGASAIVKHIRIVNMDTVPRWVKLWQGGTADVNVILPQVTIAAGGWAEFDGVLCLPASQTLSVIGEVASKLSVTVEGAEIT